jgi:hypothetical protein
VAENTGEANMLLKAEDGGEFHAKIERDGGGQVWASYSIQGAVGREKLQQGDKRLFASEHDARAWLVGEARQRGFENEEPRTVG